MTAESSQESLNPESRTDFTRYAALADAFSDEVITHSRVEDISLPGDTGRFALIRLDNDAPKRPSTLGPNSLIEFGEAVARQFARAEAREIVGLGVIGKPGCLVAGADLGAVNRVESSVYARQMAELGHQAYNLLEDFPVPSFTFINGTALGGGLEIALAAQWRTVSTEAKALALPEVFLGLIPGWGGVYRLPRLIGPEAAAQVIFSNALANNRSLTGPQAFELGIADALIPAESFEQASLEFAASVISGDDQTLRAVRDHRDRDTSAESWDRAIATAGHTVATRSGESAPAPLRALEVFTAGRHRSRDEDRIVECDALADLMVTEEFANTVYSFLELVQKRAKNPAGIPDTPPRRVRSVGIVGAGLMASQLALVFAQHLQVPVVMTDVDDARIAKGLSFVFTQVEKLQSKGKLNSEQAQKLKGLVTGSTDKAVYAEVDFVIEAVFEEITVKKKVFAELEEIVAETTILATNTSSLSVTEMAADLKHPERVVGFHFFNPVAVMPLIEVARTPHTGDEPIATAFDLAARLRKSPVLTTDSAAFVVNRVLLRLLAEVQKAFDEGTPAMVADQALKPVGLPMTPFTLLEMVGIPVAQHVTKSLRDAFGPRFHVSRNLQTLIDHGVTSIWSTAEDGTQHVTETTLDLLEFGEAPRTEAQLLHDVQDALAEEIALMLDEAVVDSPKDIDLCMILGAGWPMHRGGITPYLDQVGASQRVNGSTFH